MDKITAMRGLIYVVLLSLALTSAAQTAPLSEADLKNLLAGIRTNRTTQADFQEERVIRLMKEDDIGSELTVCRHRSNEKCSGSAASI
jgi:hypothetical protein